ncbi:Vgb family protein [Mesorhizobium ventifaucium]|uniref:Enzyme n=1 Tax=Mesorhizobium ventifaucium TaxID=666020 RepID=A0ABM9DF88_9HYPH|nr:putative enzyme [Mesorhizobium ventifaucium]
MAARAAAEEVRYYPVPEGAGPHDVAPAPDGSVWYTAQGQGALGRLDPDTGAVEQITLGDGSAPHSVIVGPDGAAWVTDGGLNAIVRVDPETEAVKAFPLPEGYGYANLNTGSFDKDGRLWFTGQEGIYGRLDPASGKVDVWNAPRGRGPYGITTTPSGEVYYASLAGNHIARIDVSIGEASPIDPPTADQGARRVWSDSKGRIWVSEWNSGQVRLACSIRQQMIGAAGSCPETSHRPMPSMSMNATRSGSPISARTPSSASTRKRRPSRASRPTATTPTCASSTGAPARYGARSPVPTALS